MLVFILFRVFCLPISSTNIQIRIYKTVTFPVVREEYRVYEHGAIKRIIGPKRGE
jgi:hypothetical protein